ncbi:MAG: hypothetical protein COA84_01455 [Robiginitomaculum sp.]|nr:MAG: hypothetical protein COA84_01455 [Robiginitomaculum sp.]
MALWSALNQLGAETDLWPIQELEFDALSDVGIETSISHLIVLCSPAAADNFSVSRAINAFLDKRQRSEIFSILTSSMQTSDGMASSYPAMLRQEWRGGRLHPTKPIEPIADLRSGSESPTKVAYKILRAAGIKPAQKKWTISPTIGRISVAAGLALILLSTSAAVVEFNTVKKVRQEAALSEQFAVGLLGKLESKLSSKSRREVFSILGTDIINTAQSKNWVNLSGDELGRLGKLLHVVGDARTTDGNVEGAIEALTLAKKVTGQLLARSPNDLERLYDHSQSVFWLGNNALTLGKYVQAKESFREYSKYSEKLVLEEPRNQKYQAELAYSNSNNGIVLLYNGQANLALEQFSQAIQMYGNGLIDIGLVKGDSLANAYSWAAIASIASGNLRKATIFHKHEEQIWTGLLEVTPNSRSRQMKFASSLIRRASVFGDMGELSKAKEILQRADQILAHLSKSYPTDKRIQRKKLAVMRDRARIDLWQNKPLNALLANTIAQNIRIRDGNAIADYNRDFETGIIDLLNARIAYASKEFEKAHTLSVLATANFERNVHKGQLFRRHFVAEALYVQGEILLALGRADQANRAWITGFSYIKNTPPDHSLREDDTRAKLLQRLGNVKEAASLRVKLERAGYHRKESMPFTNEIEELSSSIAHLQKGELND